MTHQPMPTLADEITARYAAFFKPDATKAHVFAPPAHASRHALILPPHPDDECLMGLLPLRLKRECGWTVSVAPVTYGSNKDRQEARKQELAAACNELGFSVIETALTGLDDAQILADLIEKAAPDLLVVPHALDWHKAHEATHRLVLDALSKRGKKTPLTVAETEYWHAMREPSALIAASDENLAILLRALMCHSGEIARNPYHLTLPALMLDSVRRGAERVGGAGAAAPDFAFGQLYRLSAWRDGTLTAQATKIIDLQQQADAALI